MLFLLLSLSTPFPWTPAQAQAQAPPSPTARGSVALLAREVDEVPSASRLGTEQGWLGGKGNPVEFEVCVTDEGLEVVANNTARGYHYEYVRLRISPRGAEGEAFFLMDVPHSPLRDLGGVAVLLTNGEDAAVEFELGCSMGTHAVRPYFGRIHLGPLGVELASGLAQRRPGDVERFHALERNTVETEEGTLTCSGYVDSLGRRQGVWTLLDANGCKSLESSWRNGRLDGRQAHWDGESRLRKVEHLSNGLREGVMHHWYEGGELRSLDHYSRGKAHGLRVVFHRNGRKELEMNYEHGVVVGDLRRWDSDGEFMESKPFPALWALFGTDPESMRADWRRFLGELESFSTRDDSE